MEKFKVKYNVSSKCPLHFNHLLQLISLEDTELRAGMGEGFERQGCLTSFFCQL